MTSAARYRALDRALARGLPSDPVLRAGARAAARQRLRRLAIGGLESQEERRSGMVEWLSTGPIAEQPSIANDQHYELPAEMFGLFLGPRRKYSSCWWPQPVRDLAAAEDAMLDLSARRAQVRDGMTVLDLGCGWGSMSIWLAEQYDVDVVAVSNSHRQREWIEAECRRRGVDGRVSVVTADVASYTPATTFDRVVSIEMFEHMRNWRELLGRVAAWLVPDGKAFLHVFSHRCFPYCFEQTWVAERFFTNGVMPSHDLLPRLLPPSLRPERTWAIDGTHYARTLVEWSRRFTAAGDHVLEVLVADGRTEIEARILAGGWRLFLGGTAEMWGYGNGQEWMVSHYLLGRTTSGG